MRAARSAA